MQATIDTMFVNEKIIWKYSFWFLSILIT